MLMIESYTIWLSRKALAIIKQNIWFAILIVEMIQKDSSYTFHDI